MVVITVNLPHTSYDIYIGSGLLKDVGSILFQKIKPSTCIIISNYTVANIYLDAVKKSLLNQDVEVKSILVEDAETAKSLDVANKIFQQLVSLSVDRDACIIALGGGVIGDLAGFVASTYMRGITYVQIPTTLLAQVDSAIGGKVAVDLEKGKNLIGSFYQPVLVISDVQVLQTLPERQLKSGIAEVIKYGLIFDKKLFDYIKTNINKILRKDSNILEHVVIECSKIKASIIESDEKEQGIRSILNFGHTLGHALETITNYSQYSHGEAIAIGMIFSSLLSLRFHNIDIDEYNEIEQLIKQAQLPHTISHNYDEQKLLTLMKHDKKVKNNQIRLILLSSIGQVYLYDQVTDELILEEIRKMMK